MENLSHEVKWTTEFSPFDKKIYGGGPPADGDKKWPLKWVEIN